MSDLFERQIERELHRVLDPALGTTIPVWTAPRPGSFGKRLLGGVGAALAVKVLTGVAVAAAAATVAGAATETAITGSVNPTVWGQQVKLQVDACKDRLAAGQHGIGDCVSDFTTKHAEPVSDNPQPPTASETKAPKDKKPERPAQQGTGQDNGHAESARQRPHAPSTHDSDHRSSDRTGNFVFTRPTPRP
jgi:hypothetical protein